MKCIHMVRREPNPALKALGVLVYFRFALLLAGVLWAWIVAAIVRFL